MLKNIKLPLLLVSLISLCAAITLPIFPIDETRYTSVAWEMWHGHSLIVPHLNGEPYSHKPPMLFWLMHAGWVMFGVNEITPRLIPGFFSLLNLTLVYRISLRLWPQERKTAACAVLVLASTLFWAAWSVVIMFDMVLSFWILLGLLGSLLAAQQQRGAWLLLAAAVAGGLLTKGPAVLVYLLSVPLFRFWWDSGRSHPIRAKWYLGLLGATLLGIVVALLWVIPAAYQGGTEYRNAILWGQTVNRMASSFAHQRPFWWYLPLIPVFYIPWIFFRPSFARLEIADPGTRFCLIWLGLPLVIFSMVSGKQPHYLLPFMPAGALLIGRNIARAEGLAGRTSAKAIGAVLLLLGLAAWGLSFVPRLADAGGIAPGSTWTLSAGLLMAALLLLALPFRSSTRSAQLLAIGMTLVGCFAFFEANRNFMANHAIKKTALRIKTEMDAGHPIAHLGNYHGQYQFIGRLERPLTELTDQSPANIRNFAETHPGAIFISYPQGDDYNLPSEAVVRHAQKYRGRNVVLWSFLAPDQP